MDISRDCQPCVLDDEEIELVSGGANWGALAGSVAAATLFILMVPAGAVAQTTALAINAQP